MTLVPFCHICPWKKDRNVGKSFPVHLMAVMYQYLIRKERKHVEFLCLRLYIFYQVIRHINLSDFLNRKQWFGGTYNNFGRLFTSKSVKKISQGYSKVACRVNNQSTLAHKVSKEAL